MHPPQVDAIMVAVEMIQQSGLNIQMLCAFPPKVFPKKILPLELLQVRNFCKYTYIINYTYLLASMNTA